MDKLVFNQITKIYGTGDAQVTAVNNISLTIKQGEFVAIVGPSGSGKTTLLATAGSLLKPTSGQILINGKDITSMNTKQLGRLRLQEIGFVLQSSNLVPYLTALDQLFLVAKAAGQSAREAKFKGQELLESLGLGNRLHHYPEDMSGGEKQRVGIARSLMNNPSVILADEPTASLDSERGLLVVEMLAKKVKELKKAAIMVTHDERMLGLCDRVFKMIDGKLFEVGGARGLNLPGLTPDRETLSQLS